MPGTGNAEMRHTVLLARRSLPAWEAPRTQADVLSTAINTTMRVSLSSNQGPQVDGPSGPGSWGILMTGLFLLHRRILLESFHHSEHLFYTSNSYFRFLAQSYFKQWILLWLSTTKVTIGIMRIFIKVLCPFRRENCLALQKEVVVVLSTIPCASGNHRQFWLYLHEFLNNM